MGVSSCGDQELGLYYLQSRYYDPEVGRFINSDVYAATGQGLLGNNMFNYCLNNPIMYSDPLGNIAVFDDLVIWGMAAIIVVVVIFTIPPPCIFIDTIPSFELPSIQITTPVEIEASITEAKAKKKSKSLPTKGDPNSDQNLYNEDGSIKQTRHYDSNGNAEFDIDYNHPDDGTHVFPHVHKWINGIRSTEWLPY